MSEKNSEALISLGNPIRWGPSIGTGFATRNISNYFDGRPVIGICNTWSDLTPCNAHLRDFAEIVKRGVIEAGGFPLEFPVMSLGETTMRPSNMLFKNFASMDIRRVYPG